MGAEDFIDLHDSDSDNENSELPNSNSDLAEANSQPSSSQVKEDNFNSVDFGRAEGDGGNDCMQEIELDKDLIYKSSILVDSTGLSEIDTMAEKMATVKSEVNSENGYPTQNESTTNKYKIDGSPIAGVKRARTTYVDQQPVVHVIYNSLTRDSKKKLEELLQKWSEWHTQHGSLSNDSEEVLESGEETYFPAIHVGLEKSTVSFWMDNQTKNQQCNEFIPLDDNSVPLYDRGYGVGWTSIDGSTNVERGLETLEASRCFNCGSYNHSLKECPKPRDNVAINNARKQHSSKRNQSNGPRNSTRYYQNSPGGKYDGLKPGVLSAETRQLLGLGELDPPPWLNRMREIGYPPGYLDPEEEDQPSGITIYADEETNKTQHQEEDGEILEKDDPDPQKKMSVEFPGINAPIPENADGKRWATSNETSFDSSGNRSHYRSSRSSGQQHRDHIRSRDHRDDGSPREPGIGSSHMPQYSGYNPIGNESHSPRNYAPIPRSPNLGRSLSDRVRWSPLAHEGSPNHSPYNSFPYTSPNARHSPQSYGSPSFENWAPHNLTPDLSSHRKDRHDRDRHHHRNRN